MSESVELRLGLSKALEALGDRWSLEVLRLAAEGAHYFGDFSRALDATDAVLSKRLKHLRARGLIDRTPAPDAAHRWRYRPTEPTLELWKARLSTWRWDQVWVPHAESHAVQVVHATCGKSVLPAFGCGSCRAIGVTPRDVVTTISQRLSAELSSAHSKRIVRLAARSTIDATSLLGDGWSTALLGSTLLGVRTFSELRATLGRISSATLSEKLQRFVNLGLLVREPPHTGGRPRYRPSPKALDFFPVFAALIEWAQSWGGETGMSFTHRQCGQPLAPRYTCNSCNREMRRTTTLFVTSRPPRPAV